MRTIARSNDLRRLSSRRPRSRKTMDSPHFSSSATRRPQSAQPNWPAALLPSRIAAALARVLALFENRLGHWVRQEEQRQFFNGAAVVFAGFVASRLIIFAIIVLSRMVMVHAAWWHPGGLVSVLTQWDGELWYIQIARHGYHIAAGDHLPHGFFPLYPLLIKLFSIVFRDLRIAALVVSHLSLLTAALFLNALVRLDYKDPRVSRAAVMLFLFNPVAFFYSNAYTESTFFMLATIAFFAARKGRWLAACLAGMLLAASRPPGVLIVLPLAFEYLRHWWLSDRTLAALLERRILLLALVPLGLGLYMAYDFVAFHDALAFSHAAKVFGRSFTSPLHTLSFLRTYTTFYYLLFSGTVVITLLLLLLGVGFRLRASYLIFAASLTFLYLCSATFEAFPRYVSVEFPLFIVLGLLAAKFRWSYEPLLGCSVCLLGLLTIMSANGYWMT